MTKISASLSSKGQITLPKSVRDMLELQTGDQVHFTIQSGGSVTMEKAPKEADTIYNLIDLLVNVDRKKNKSGNLLSVVGQTGIGKTKFIADYTYKYLEKKTVLYIDYEGFNELSKEHAIEVDIDITNVSLDKVIQHNPDIVILDEAHYLKDFSVINSLRDEGIHVIMITQALEEHECILLGEHFSIEMIHHSKMLSDQKKYRNNNYALNAEKMDLITIENSKAIRKTIYSQ